MNNNNYLEYQKNRNWSDKKNNEVIELLKTISKTKEPFQVAPYQEDLTLGRDFISQSGKTIACRLRQMQFYGFNDITIRSKTDSIHSTEWQKLLEHKCSEYYLFGWIHPKTHKIVFWELYLTKDIIEAMQFAGDEIDNKDGTFFKPISKKIIKPLLKGSCV